MASLETGNGVTELVFEALDGSASGPLELTPELFLLFAGVPGRRAMQAPVATRVAQNNGESGPPRNGHVSLELGKELKPC
jgi:hypothetical protein